MRAEKTDAVETISAEIDGLEASLAKLEEDLQELAKDIAELQAAMKKASTLRHNEKAENEATIADAQAPEEAVAQALLVLKDFYKKAGDSTALLQEEPAPEIFDEPYASNHCVAASSMRYWFATCTVKSLISFFYQLILWAIYLPSTGPPSPYLQTYGMALALFIFTAMLFGCFASVSDEFVYTVLVPGS